MKGEYGDKCNRTVCDKHPAVYYNYSTKKYYCTGCAKLINLMNQKDAFEMFGHELCILGKVEE